MPIFQKQATCIILKAFIWKLSFRKRPLMTLWFWQQDPYMDSNHTNHFIQSTIVTLITENVLNEWRTEPKIHGGLGVPILKVSYQECQRTLAELLFLFRHMQFSQEQAPCQKSSQPGTLPMPREQQGGQRMRGLCSSAGAGHQPQVNAHIPWVLIMEAR